MRKRCWYRPLAAAILTVMMVLSLAAPFGGPNSTIAGAAAADRTAAVAHADEPEEWVIGSTDGARDLADVLASVTGGGGRESLAAWLASWGLTLLDADERVWLVQGGGEQIGRLQDAYPGLFIQPNRTYQLSEVVKAARYRVEAVGYDELANLQWGLETAKVTKAWEMLKGRELQEVVVAVVDTGVDYTHPDLDGQVLENGYNAFNPDALPEDDNGHGTHVAGVIAAAIGNGQGVRGVAGFPAIKIMPIKVMNEEGKGSTYEIARGIDYAVDRGVDVINLSIGGPEEDPFIRESVMRAIRKGIPVVAAAGNNGMPASISTPANVEEALTVGAIKKDRQWLPESNFGPEVDLAAPGEQILSTYWRAVVDYAYMTGTSAAAPFVTGVVALMKAVKPDLSVDAVRLYLTRNAEPLGDVDKSGRNDYFGYGLLRADRVLEALLQYVDNAAAGWNESPSPVTPGPEDGTGTSAGQTVWFSDVPDDHWAGEAIRYVVTQKWFGGFPDGTFKPSEQMKRAQTAAVFTDLLDLPLAVPRFQDVNSNHWAVYKIGAVQEMGLMTGDKGYFRPNAPLTRAQFAKVLVHAFNLSAPKGGAGAGRVTFSDVRPGDWFVPYAEIVSGLDLMRGNEEGKFLPNRPITRAEVAVILHRYFTQSPR